ncbi:MAG: sulfite exporter TauE/SafE family protein [Gemmatimonadota bacterium]
MSLAAFALSFLVGGVAGTASGLLGIGGGLLMVPFLYFLMGSSSWSGLAVPLEYQAALAHATSLAVIVPTALSGLVTFRRMGVVPWSTVLPLGAAAALTALLGARVAVELPTPFLKAAFGAFLLYSGARLLRRAPPTEDVPATEGGIGRRRAWVGGGAIGFLSALLGVGGGIVAVPILIHWARLELHRVVPASIAIIVFAAPAGVLSYSLAGAGIGGLPPGSFGYVHLPSALAMIPGAVLCAPLGARWNQRMARGTLRPLFAALLLVVGVQLVWVHGGPLLFGS